MVVQQLKLEMKRRNRLGDDDELLGTYMRQALLSSEVTKTNKTRALSVRRSHAGRKDIKMKMNKIQIVCIKSPIWILNKNH